MVLSVLDPRCSSCHGNTAVPEVHEISRPNIVTWTYETKKIAACVEYISLVPCKSQAHACWWIEMWRAGSLHAAAETAWYKCRAGWKERENANLEFESPLSYLPTDTLWVYHWLVKWRRREKDSTRFFEGSNKLICCKRLLLFFLFLFPTFCIEKTKQEINTRKKGSYSKSFLSL